ASIVLVVAIGVSGLIVAQQHGRSPAQTTLAQIQELSDAKSATTDVAGGGTATAHWSDSLGKAVLVTDGLPAIATDRVFELWFVRDGGPEPAGVFTAASGDATAALTGAMHAGDTIAVTVEQAGGSPSGKPTTDPIVAIPTA
ncbi:MAG: anti-sigma factor, partial [Microbacterium sp.]|nr:anti-sigma factor [Microbacterium sp.]